MASSITTQADILTYTTIGDNELSRLETQRMEDDNWASMHTKAWTLIKEYLEDRRPSIAESDLDDTDELLQMTCYAVLYLAYQESQFISEDDAGRKKYWFKKMRKAVGRKKLTVNGATTSSESYLNRRSLRA